MANDRDLILMHMRKYGSITQDEAVEEYGIKRLSARINERGEIGFFPADGGVWKLEATRNVAGYFENALKDLIEAGTVVVIR